MSQDVGELATRLIEVREELQDIGEHVEQLDIRDREVLVEIFDDQAELCLQLAQALEVRAPFDPQDHKLDEDQVLTDGGGIPCPDCGESKPKYGDCRHCGYQPYTTDGGTSTGGSDRTCPNCGEVSDSQYESGNPAYREFECWNRNCRCQVFRSLHTDKAREDAR